MDGINDLIRWLGTLDSCAVSDALDSLDLPPAVTARTARGRIVEEDFNCPVRVGDVTVEPGDLVIADASAIVFAPRGRTEEVLADAERITEKERLMMEAMVAGEPVGQVMTADYESMPDDRG